MTRQSRKFQFLGRNSGRSDSTQSRAGTRGWREFQFLGRNSGRSDPRTNATQSARGRAFQFLGRNSGRSDHHSIRVVVVLAPVSIPRSEFWSFGLFYPDAAGLFQGGFNSSVGILVVRTSAWICEVRALRRVSIPRSEFWSFGLVLQGVKRVGDAPVSIPRSEFWSFGLIPGRALVGTVLRFNSSVGILVVRTAKSQIEHWIGEQFQFLGRNSGRSDSRRRARSRTRRVGFNSSVGILVVRTYEREDEFLSEFEFQFLGRNSGRSDDLSWQEVKAELDTVSIPRSEFWSFGRRRRRIRHRLNPRFNSSVGILVVRTRRPSRPSPRLQCRFQFLGRNSGRSDAAVYRERRGGGAVSIPRSEFWSFGPGAARRAGDNPTSFNSSVGILVVRTTRVVRGSRKQRAFQFLGRNSGRSDSGVHRRPAHSVRQFQFLGRNSGRSDKR